MTLVYTSSKHYDTIPITDTQTIADAAELSHDTVQNHIRSHPEEFGLLGKVRLSSSEMRNLAGESYFPLNEAQAATLFSYLRNTEANRELDMELQRQFGEVKFELYLRQQQRAKCIAARQECIDLAKGRGMSKSEDANCCDFAFQMAFGKSMSQYRSDNGIFGGKRTVDYMPIADLNALTKAHEAIAEMMSSGRNFECMKSQVMKQTAANEITPEKKTGNPFWSFIARKLRPFWPCDRCKQDDDAT